jgi:anti-sigma B factor antagonist
MVDACNTGPLDSVADYRDGRRRRVQPLSSQRLLFHTFTPNGCLMTDTIQPTSVRCIRTDDGLLIRLTGDIDMSSWPQLDEAYATVTGAPPGPVTVDLAEATFVDSTTLGFLAKLHQHVTTAGHTFLIESPNRVVRRAIEICGLDRVLTIR